MKVDGQERMFERTHVTTGHEVGDSFANGTIMDLLAGGPLGVAYASFADCYTASRVCRGSEIARNRTIGGTLFGAIGFGIGAVMDKQHERRTPRYARTVRPRAPAASLAPPLGVAGARRLVTVAWAGAEPSW